MDNANLQVLVDNREGHLRVAAGIEAAAEFTRTYASGDCGETLSAGRPWANEHEIYCTVMPEGMLGVKSDVLCLVKRSASRWSSMKSISTTGLDERRSGRVGAQGQ